jgi:hypothetical protein
VAATVEKASTYVFAERLIRSEEAQTLVRVSVLLNSTLQEFIFKLQRRFTESKKRVPINLRIVPQVTFPLKKNVLTESQR